MRQPAFRQIDESAKPDPAGWRVRMVTTRRLIAIFPLALLLTACDGKSPEERRKALHLPPAGFAGDTVKGHAIFNQYCVTCHGLSGSGTDKGPPLVHVVYRPAHHADLAFHLAVKNGVKAHHWPFGDMQPVSDVSPEMTAHVVAYVRQLQRKANID